MKKIDLGQMLALIANVGVIVGILLLVYELNQNRAMMEAQVRQQVSQGVVDVYLGVAANPDLAEIVVDFADQCTTMDECRSAEEFRFNQWSNATFRTWENAHYQYRLGLYDETEFSAQKESWRNILTRPGIANRWRSVRMAYSAEFAAEVDTLLPD